MPEKMIGTLTSSILKSVHTSISPIFSYKLCSVATPGHPEPFLLENHSRIVALTPDLQRVSFYSVTDVLHYSSTTELILSLILYTGDRHQPCGCCGVQIHIRSPRGSIPLSKRLTIFGLERNDPARPLSLRHKG